MLGTLSLYPLTLSAADNGYLEQGKMIGGTYDSNGNLEATPPCVVPLAGKNYPFGRIYDGRGLVGPGEEFDFEREVFLEQQIVQDPFLIDTDWLSVGHVDETVTILPGGGSQGFKIGLPSPNRAYQILDNHNDLRLRPGTSHLLTGRKFNRGGAWVSAEVSIANFLGDRNSCSWAGGRRAAPI